MSIRRVLVVDTSVLVNAAGGQDAKVPTSINCLAVTEAIYTICHKVAVSPMLQTEWDNHASVYSRKWQAAMLRRGKIVLVEAKERPGIRQKVLEKYEHATAKQDAVLKDFHLVEAAIEADRIVISLDNTVRDLFGGACDEDDKLSEIMWVHPNDEDILDWLEKGALPDPEKYLIVFRKE